MNYKCSLLNQNIYMIAQGKGERKYVYIITNLSLDLYDLHIKSRKLPHERFDTTCKINLDNSQ